ncbi:MAG TPA: hypothetical protein VK285_01520 [Gaiellaceae bacterium]|nr:hypothetical protein [Gaiellaceae bacterium]
MASSSRTAALGASSTRGGEYALVELHFHEAAAIVAADIEAQALGGS